MQVNSGCLVSQAILSVSILIHTPGHRGALFELTCTVSQIRVKCKSAHAPTRPSPGMAQTLNFDLRLFLYSGKFDTRLCVPSQAFAINKTLVMGSLKINDFVILSFPLNVHSTHVIPRFHPVFLLLFILG